MNRRSGLDDPPEARNPHPWCVGTHRVRLAGFFLALMLLAWTVLLGPVQAQSPAFGVEIGGSIVSLNFNTELSPTLVNRVRPSYSVMAFADFPVFPVLGVQTGVRYVGLGTRIEAYGGHQIRAHVGTERVYHTYLAFPVRARVQLHGPWFVTVGPEFGYLLAAHASVRVPEESLPAPSEPSHWVEPLTDYSKTWNPVVSAAFGRRLHWGRFRYHVQLGYSYGLRTIGRASSNDARTEELLLSLGIAFWK